MLSHPRDGKILCKLVTNCSVYTILMFTSLCSPRKPWTGVEQAVNDPPGCPQDIPCAQIGENYCPKSITEDCLFLNVFTPLKAAVCVCVCVCLCCMHSRVVCVTEVCVFVRIFILHNIGYFQFSGNGILSWRSLCNGEYEISLTILNC